MLPLQPSHLPAGHFPQICMAGKGSSMTQIISFPQRGHFLCLQPALSSAISHLSSKVHAPMFHLWDCWPAGLSRGIITAPLWKQAREGPRKQCPCIIPFLMLWTPTAMTSAEGVRCWPKGSLWCWFSTCPHLPTCRLQLYHANKNINSSEWKQMAISA